MKLPNQPKIILPALIVIILVGFYIALSRGCGRHVKTIPPMKGKPVTWLCEKGHSFQAPAGVEVRTCPKAHCGARAYQATLFECPNGHTTWIWFKPEAHQFRYVGVGHDWQSLDEPMKCPECGAPLQPAGPG
jgi:hypothetical protein